MRLLRVFPRRTRATPVDQLAYVGGPDLLAPTLEPDAVHVSVTWAGDLDLARQLAETWERCLRVPVEIGGPALQAGGEFTPGQYLRPGYVITSRGCPNRCWFCDVPRREGAGPPRELAIHAGWNVLDDNLLACSERHIRAVFAMLERQRRRVEFTGGLEARRLEDWHVHQLALLRPRPAVWFAYDTPDDYEPLVEAGRKLRAAGFTTASHRVRCYMLIGHPRDTLQAAEVRLRQAMAAGFMPMAMLWHLQAADDWRRFQRLWSRPAIIASRITVQGVVQ
jgi:hypothetical protein